MRLYSTLILFLVAGIVATKAQDLTPGPNIIVPLNAKADQKALNKNLKEARDLSNLSMKPNFANARKEIAKAMENSQFKVNEFDVLLEAGNVEYNCYDFERNKPATGEKIDNNVLISSTEKGFEYFNSAYEQMIASGMKVRKSIKTNIQKKAWTLFSVTEGFRANAATCFKKEDWNGAHHSFNLFLSAVDSRLLNDYGIANSYVKSVLSLYKNDSIIAHARYFRAISSLKMDSTAQALNELEAIIYDGYNQNVVLQQLCHLYQNAGDEENVERIFNLGFELLPNEPWYARNLVNIYLQRKDYDEAAVVIDHLIAVDPDNSANLALKGQLVELQGDSEQALEYYEKAHELDSGNAEVYSHLGRIWYNRAKNIETSLIEKRQFANADAASMPVYQQAVEYYLTAYEFDTEHTDKTIANAIRTILYKQFTKANCPNKDELIRQYNEVSRAYGMTEFPR